VCTSISLSLTLSLVSDTSLSHCLSPPLHHTDPSVTLEIDSGTTRHAPSQVRAWLTQAWNACRYVRPHRSPGNMRVRMHDLSRSLAFSPRSARGMDAFKSTIVSSEISNRQTKQQNNCQTCCYTLQQPFFPD
jgi:hypothetical protein